MQIPKPNPVTNYCLHILRYYKQDNEAAKKHVSQNLELMQLMAQNLERLRPDIRSYRLIDE